jgi:hypothetical protein
MRAQYPEEMTVVLQHQFWDLVVTEEQFEAGLSFGGVPERVVVPFAAIKSFVDPSVQFGVQFELLVAGEEGVAKDGTRPPAEHRPTSATPAAVPTPANPPSPEPVPAKPPAAEKQDGADAPTGGAQVVSLDRFRKK